MAYAPKDTHEDCCMSQIGRETPANVDMRPALLRELLTLLLHIRGEFHGAESCCLGNFCLPRFYTTLQQQQHQQSQATPLTEVSWHQWLSCSAGRLPR
jgi:hypothetical protein